MQNKTQDIFAILIFVSKYSSLR